MLECSVILSLVAEGSKKVIVLDLEGVVSQWLRPQGTNTLTTARSLVGTEGDPLRLQWLLSSLAPPGPEAKDQGRQQWWLELASFTNSAVRGKCQPLCSGRGQLQTYM